MSMPLVGNVKVPGHEFVTTIPAAQLLKITRDPRLTENESGRIGTPELEDVYQIRRQVQRAFEGAKAKNVEPYANYIVALSQGGLG